MNVDRGKGRGTRIPVPFLVSVDECKVVWVGARGNQTVVAVNESLVSDQNLGKCHVFADTKTIGKQHNYVYLCFSFSFNV